MKITLHCRPYIKHWLEMKYGNPVKIPAKTNFSQRLKCCLMKQFHPSRDYGKKIFPETVEMTITGDPIELGHTIPPTLTNFVNSVIREDIEMEIYHFVNGAKRNGHSQNEAFLLYQTKYAFTEDTFSIDAIRQIYFRFAQKINTFFSTSVTDKPSL